MYYKYIIYVKCRGFNGGTRWSSWLKQYVTNRKVARSIPDGATGIIRSDNSSCLTMVLGSTQPLTEMSKGKGHPITGYQVSRGGVDV
jgi:hypothetical protein